MPRFLKEVIAPEKVLIIQDIIDDFTIDDKYKMTEETLTKKVKIKWDLENPEKFCKVLTSLKMCCLNLGLLRLEVTCN